MQVNDVLFGFRVERTRENAELNGRLWELRHGKTGAKLAWLDNGESNKLFSITFKTLPWNHTGVFHILEHCVLNGSREFPVKEPFVNLLKSSMNTFLNAMTFPDKTMFPVSSRNEQDFLNLTKVYLDAVFCPAIYENPNIFYQEGWHYELEDENAVPSYNGVVFNEMKGAFSSPDTQLNEYMMGLLFPDTSYGFVSGGHPAHIPELSYEEFLQTHRDFYHPGNSYTYLDGAVPLDKVLPMLDGYFSAFEAGKCHEVKMQADTPYAQATQYYEGQEDALFLVAQKISSWEDRTTLTALAALCNYLTGTNESPLKKAILESGIAQEAVLFIEDSMAQPFIGLQLRQMDAGRKEELLEMVRSFLAEHRIDGDHLAATVDQMEFSVRDAQEPKGLMRNILGMNTWLFGGDLMEGITFTPIFETLRAGFDFESLLRQIRLDGENAAELLLLPSETKGEEDRLAENCRLQAASADWTGEDRREILARNEKLLAWQSAEDSREAVQTLPVLPLTEISREPEEIRVEVTDTCLYLKTASGEISHFNLYFALDDCSKEQLQQLSFMTNLIGSLPTGQHSVPELELLEKQTIGFMDFNVMTYPVRDDSQACRPCFVVSFSCLKPNEEAALGLIRELLQDTCYQGEDLKEWIGIMLAQCRESLYQSILSGGNRFAVVRAAAHYSAVSDFAELTDGYTFYRWLRELEENFDRRIEPLQQNLEDLAQSIFHAGRMTVAVAAGEKPNLDGFLASMAGGSYDGKGIMAWPTDNKPALEGIVIPAAVSYAASCGRFGLPYQGSMDALSNILNFDYLWSEVRVKGSAYGCNFQISTNGFVSFSSYRDPAPVNSLAVYQNAGAFGEDFAGELSQYIIGAAAAQEPLLHDRQTLNRAVGDHIMGISHGQRCAWRTQLLEAELSDLHCAARSLQDTVYASCIVGSRESIPADWKRLEL